MPESTVTLDATVYTALQEELATLRQRVQACEAQLAGRGRDRPPSLEAMTAGNGSPRSPQPSVPSLSAEASRRFQRLADNGLGTLYQFRLEPDGSASFPYISVGCRALVGLDPAVIMQDANLFVALTHPDDLERFRASVARSAATLEPWYWEGRLLLPDNTVKWVKAESRPERLSDGATVWDGWILDTTPYRQAAERLQTANARFTTAIEGTKDAFCAFNHQWQFTYVNHRIERLANKTKSELIGQSIWTLFPETVDSMFYQQYHRAVERQEAVAFEEYYPPLDTWFEIRAYPVGDELFVYFTDISDRKHLEARITERTAALKRTAAQLEAVLNNSPAAIYVKDLQGRFTLANRTLEKIFRRSQAEIIGCTGNDIFSPENVAAIQKNDRAVLASKEAMHVEEDALLEDGLHTYVSVKFPLLDESGQPYAVCGISTDITERQQAEAKLQEALALQNAIFASTNYGIVSTDIHGTIRSFNAAAERLTGYPAAELVGIQTPALLHDPAEVAQRTAELNAELGLHLEPGFETFVAKARRGDVDESEWTYIRQDGSRLPVQLCVSALHNEAGEIAGFVGIASDITERKQAEATQLKLSALVENSSDFIGIASLEGQVQYLNPAGHRLVGLSAQVDVRNYTMSDFNPPWQLARLEQEILKTLYATGIWQGESYMQHFETHEAIAVETNLFLVREPETQEPICVACFARDIRDRQRAEQQLRETNELYQQILDAIPDLVLCKGSESRIIYGNKAFRDYYGMTLPEVQGIADAPNVQPDCTQQSVRDDAYVFETGETVRVEEAVIRHDGTERLFSTIKTAIFDLQEQVIQTVGISRDITERKQDEQELLIYKQAVESCSDAIGIATPDGCHFYHNPAFSAMYGCETPEIFNAWGGIPQAFTDAQMAKAMLQSIRAGHRWVNEVEHRDRHGRIFQNLIRANTIRDPEGKIVGLLGIMTDITARKQVEAALRQTTANLQDAQRLARIGNWSVDLRDQTLYWSEEVFRIFGRDRALGVPAVEPSLMYYHPEDRQSLSETIFRVAETLEPCQLELPIVRGDGTAGHVHIKAEAADTHDGRPTKLFGTIMDITDRKQAEIQLQQQKQELEDALRELRTTQVQLIQSEKMSSLGQLVAGIAHEINNPVNFIYGNLVHTQEYAENLLAVVDAYQAHYPEPVTELQELTEDVDLDFVIQDFPRLLDSMKIGAQRIREIVTSLRTFSRLDEAECKDANIHEGIDSTLLILQNRLKAKSDRPAIEIVKQYGPLSQVECYPSQLNQVFMNILANALDAMEERDSQRTLAEKKANPSGIWIATAQEQSGWLTIRIRDNGPGMNERVRDRLFDPFFSTKATGKGTGLGMSISYQIVTERHGGTLTCTSELGQGAEFAIAIPIRQATAAAS